MAKRLKQQYLRLADNQELLQGVQGEIITADVLKPYIDALATKTNAQDIQAAVTTLENKILGGVDMDGDTLSELYAKITTLKNLTDADKTGLVALISAKADEASVAFRLSAKADEASVASRLADKADEASVASRLADKADEASVASRLADKSDEASVALRLSEKITSAQAESIAQSITNSLEIKIMGGVGTDADTFAELKGLLDNLQSLSEADVNGVMTALSAKLDKAVFDEFFEKVPVIDAQGNTTSNNYIVKPAIFEAKTINASNIVLNGGLTINSNDPFYTFTENRVKQGIVAGSETTFVMLSNSQGNYRRINIVQFLNILATDVNSPISQRIKQLEDRVLELEGMFENV